LLSGWTFHDSLLSSSSVLFTSRPVTVAATKPAFQMCSLLIAVVYLYWGYLASIQVASHGVYRQESSSIRFSILGLRNPEIPVSAGNPVLFGLLLNGCKIGQDNSTLNGTAILSFVKPVVANGYYLRIPEGSIFGDPVLWRVESFAESWTTIGASVWRGQGDQAIFYPHLAYPTPEQRNLQIKVDSRPSWQWFLSDVVICFTTSLGWLFFSISRHIKRQSAGVLIISALFGSNSLLQAAAAVGFGMAENWRECLHGWINSAPDALLAVSIWWNERHAVLSLLAYGVLKLVPLVIQTNILFMDRSGMLVNILSNGGFLALVITGANIVFHRRALSRAHTLVLVDKAKYDAIWANILADSEEQASIQSLDKLTKYLGRCITKQSRQLKRIRSLKAEQHRSLSLSGFSSSSSLKLQSAGDGVVIVKEAWESLLDCGIPAIPDQSHPVRSLDQLYLQAIALNGILIAKVQTWAAASSGCFSASADRVAAPGESRTGFGSFKLRSLRNNRDHSHQSAADTVMMCRAGSIPDGYVRWEDVKEEEMQVGGKVRWAKVKAVQRSIEKSTRSYGKDVSRLLDICRQSIYFETISGILACLAVIGRDPDVMIARIKNRFDATVNSAASAGYRNLAVNLRLVSAETQAIGIETHLCEVQLILLKMAVIKNDEGHKKYITFRNLRGE